MPQHQPTPAKKARNTVRERKAKFTEELRNQLKEQERRSSKPMAGPSEPDRHSREQWPVRLTARNGTGFGLAFGVAIGRAGDRDVIVSGFDDGTVRRWDAATSDPIGTPLVGHTSQVRAVAIGRVRIRARIRDVIVSGSADGTVRRWDAVTGDPIGTPLVGHRGLRSSGLGDRGTFGPVGHVWSVAAGRVGDRDVIVSGCDDGEVVIWKAATGGLVGRLDAIADGVNVGDPVHTVAICRAGDRDLIAAGSADGLWIWDVTGGSVRILRAGDFGPCVWSVAAGRVGDRHVFVSGSSEGKVEIWDAVTGDPIGTPLTGHRGDVRAVAIGRAGGCDVIVSGSADRTVQILDSTVRIWDAVTGDPVGAPVDHDSGILAVALGQAGGRDLIVSGHRDGTVTVREHHRSQQQP